MNTTYSEHPVHRASLEDRDGMRAPLVMLEGLYENSYDMTPQTLRAQAYEPLLAGSAGHIFGSWPVWKFADGWRASLDSDGAISMTHLWNLFAALEWWTLEPAHDTGFAAKDRGR